MLIEEGSRNLVAPYAVQATRDPTRPATRQRRFGAGAMISIKNSWMALVQHFAEEAARDPVRRLARLEAPPVPKGFDSGQHPESSLAWRAADAAYREEKRKLETEIKEGRASSDAFWSGLARMIYSGQGLVGLITALWILFWLHAFGILEVMARLVREFVENGWSVLVQ